MQTHKKILYTITKAHWGGPQRYLYDVSTYFAKKYAVVVAHGGTEGVLAERLAHASVRTIMLPSLQRNINIQNDIRAFFQLFRAIKQEKPDVLHLNSLKDGVLGAFVGRLLGVPRIIFTAHGWAWNETAGISFEKIIIYSAYFVMLLLSHTVIAVSQDLSTQLPFSEKFKKKMRVIKLGIGVPVLLSQEEARKSIPATTSDTLIIGTIAALHPIKGIVYALRALHAVPSPHTTYAVWGEGPGRKTLEEEIARLNLENVSLQGHVHNAEKYINAFDIFMLSSLKEGLPYVLLEAGNAGLPVIATRVGGIPEIIEDGKTGLLVPPKDPEALARALTTLIENPTVRTQLGSALQKKVREEFSLERMLTATEALYS